MEKASSANREAAKNEIRRTGLRIMSVRITLTGVIQPITRHDTIKPTVILYRLPAAGLLPSR